MEIAWLEEEKKIYGLIAAIETHKVYVYKASYVICSLAVKIIKQRIPDLIA